MALFHPRTYITPMVGYCCPILNNVENNYSCRFERPPGREYRCADLIRMMRLTTALLESCAGESEGEISSIVEVNVEEPDDATSCGSPVERRFGHGAPSDYHWRCPVSRTVWRLVSSDFRGCGRLLAGTC